MVDTIIKEAKERMQKAIEALRNEFASLRTGRASTSLLDRIMVDYYGVKTPLNQVGTVSAPEARLLTIQPWDISMMQAVEKAIMASDLGLTPSNDGKIIRLSIPELNEERRTELVKIAKRMAEEARVSVRTIRRDANDKLKKLEKDHEISQDEMHTRSDEAQKSTDKFIDEINSMLSQKEQEILEV